MSGWVEPLIPVNCYLSVLPVLHRYRCTISLTSSCIDCILTVFLLVQGPKQLRIRCYLSVVHDVFQILPDFQQEWLDRMSFVAYLRMPPMDLHDQGGGIRSLTRGHGPSHGPPGAQTTGDRGHRVDPGQVGGSLTVRATPASYRGSDGWRLISLRS